MFTTDQLHQTLGLSTKSTAFLVAYSGGLDSHVLLHAMATLAEKNSAIKLRAIHINHGLNQNANQWEQHAIKVCAELRVALSIEFVDLEIKPGDSVEAVARAARYAVFEKYLKPDEVLLTAHNQNDQAETLLLQLLRGAGVKGLAAMPGQKTFGKSILLRPLLAFTREDLQTYAKKQALKWVEDDSNANVRFDRNYIRHRVLPLLKKRWPKALGTLTRSADHCAEASALIDELADMDLKQLRDTSDVALHIKPLMQLSRARQRNALRRWIYLEGFSLPTAKQVEEIVQALILASQEAQPKVTWGDAELRRFQDKLYLMKPLRLHHVSDILMWDLKNPLKLPGNLGILSAEKKLGKGLVSTLNKEKISVRFRQGGEVCRPERRKETQTLKNLMHAWKVPPWQRDRIPLLYYDDQLIAVVGYCVCEGFAVKDDEVGYDIRH